MPTTLQDKQFGESLASDMEVRASNSALDSAINWISDNLNPDDVFSDKDLAAWAENNGYKKE